MIGSFCLVLEVFMEIVWEIEKGVLLFLFVMLFDKIVYWFIYVI